MPASRSNPNTKPKAKKTKGRVFKVLLKVFGFFTLFLALYTVTVIANSPKIDPDNIYSYLNESSIIYDENGKEIDTVYKDGGNRINVKYDDIPEDLINAVVAIEDKTFWEHHGFNIRRIFGAIRESILGGGQISGTSTVTQQLARNVYLPDTKGIRSLGRKISEAWYTILLEHKLSKKEIMEAYMNTIYLGNNSYGVAAASKSYFAKDLSKLKLYQCVALAAIPKSPNEYALVRTIDNDTIEEEAIKLKKKDILEETDEYTMVYNGDVSKERRELTLNLMQEQGYISDEQCEKAKKKSIKKAMHLESGSAQGYNAYFSDYVVEEVINDLVDEGYTRSTAKNMIYTGGLRIYSTFDEEMQSKIEQQFEQSYNFPGINYSSVRFDDNGNILSTEGDLLYYKYSNFFNKAGNFKLKKNEYKFDDEGNMYLLRDKRLRFIKTTTEGKSDYTINFKPMFSREDGTFYSIDGGVLLVPQQYKSLDSDENLKIDASFFTDYPDFFTKKGSKYIVTKKSYQLSQKTRQPQAAMVIIDNKDGEVKAMVGGRSNVGKMMYNRADSPRQPGSAIKPLSVYSTALMQGEEAAKKNSPMKFTKYDKNDRVDAYGKYWTASSRINDAPMYVNGRLWPKNVYNGYKGSVTLRTSVEQSINVNAVRVFMQIGSDDAIKQLKNFGVTSVVEDDSVNDKNAAALALGGMTKGISPLQMASAYQTFPGEGKHIEAKAYTKVTDNQGEVILKNDHKSNRVISEGVAFIMSDILRSTVRNGTAKSAAIAGKTVCGKTGTTSNQYDAWFCGFTPEYSASLWIGNDVNLELTEGSAAATRLWRSIMINVTAGLSGKLPEKPSNVTWTGKEYYINGTQGWGRQNDQQQQQQQEQEQQETKQQVIVTLCTQSGYAATPNCPVAQETQIDADDIRGKYFCPIHNPDPQIYPTAP